MIMLFWLGYIILTHEHNTLRWHNRIQYYSHEGIHIVIDVKSDGDC